MASELDDAKRLGVKTVETDADDRISKAEAEVRREMTLRVAAESDQALMNAKVDALNRALIESEGNTLRERSAKSALERELATVRAEIVRLEAALQSAGSVGQFTDTILGHIKANAADVSRHLTAAKPSTGGTPSFKLDFKRDSQGRIQTPVIATPQG